MNAQRQGGDLTDGINSLIAFASFLRLVSNRQNYWHTKGQPQK